MRCNHIDRDLCTLTRAQQWHALPACELAHPGSSTLLSYCPSLSLHRFPCMKFHTNSTGCMHSMLRSYRLRSARHRKRTRSQQPSDGDAAATCQWRLCHCYTLTHSHGFSTLCCPSPACLSRLTPALLLKGCPHMHAPHTTSSQHPATPY